MRFVYYRLYIRISITKIQNLKEEKSNQHQWAFVGRVCTRDLDTQILSSHVTELITRELKDPILLIMLHGPVSLFRFSQERSA